MHYRLIADSYSMSVRLITFYIVLVYFEWYYLFIFWLIFFHPDEDQTNITEHDDDYNILNFLMYEGDRTNINNYLEENYIMNNRNYFTYIEFFERSEIIEEVEYSYGDFDDDIISLYSEPQYDDLDFIEDMSDLEYQFATKTLNNTFNPLNFYVKNN